MKKRLAFIIFFLLIFLCGIYVWNNSYQISTKVANTTIAATYDYTSIPTESAVFERSDKALSYKKMNETLGEKQRSLNSYYDNRPFPGAPPYIPHPISITWERNIGSSRCLKCHGDGGYVAKYNAFAPVTPHPERLNCRQCHVTTNMGKNAFKLTNYQKLSPPAVGVNQILVDVPPTIPHEVDTRANCLACHAGPAAPKEIRVTHPERINCKQCHVPINNHKTNVRFTR